MHKATKKILILFAHPNQSMSEVGVPLAEVSRATDGVTVIDLYALYPDMEIDVDAEQARLLEHDVIVFLHPFYWYSVPAILKEWQDLVLEYGFAYGTDGTALHGKIFLSALTTGGHEDAYGRKGYNNFTVRQLLAPIEQTADLCGMIYLPPFVVFGARAALDEGAVPGITADWQRILCALRDDELTLKKAQKLEYLNQNIGKKGGAAWKPS